MTAPRPLVATEAVAAEPAAPPRAWRVVAASVAGRSHEADGTPCQDYAGHCLAGDDMLFVAVADGAGSAERAEIGAHLAVEAALLALATGHEPEATRVDAAALRTAFAEARETIAHRAAQDERPLAAYATTLTCLAAWPDGAIVGRIGDGFAVVEDVAGGLALVPPGRPNRGEYANETVFLTSLAGDDALDDHLEISELAGPIRSVAVSSDGLLRLAVELAGYRPHPRFFGPLFAFAGSGAATDEQLVAFLASDRVRARTDDDATLVLAVLADRPEAEPEPPSAPTT